MRGWGWDVICLLGRTERRGTIIPTPLEKLRSKCAGVSRDCVQSSALALKIFSSSAGGKTVHFSESEDLYTYAKSGRTNHIQMS